MIELLSVLIATQGVNNFTETEVKFQGAGIELVGTLSVPESKAAMPAVLMLPGSGPTDRNGNQPPSLITNLLKDLSGVLNEEGFITFRFDKRPVHHYSAVWPKEMSTLSEFFSMENHLADVEAAFTFMSKQKGVDSTRLYILGHSEGGMFATALAAKLKARGLILLGAPGRGMDAILTEQLHANIGQLPDGELKTRLLADVDRAIKELKEKPETPKDIHPSLASLFNPSTPHIMHGYFNFDPIAEANKFKGSVFIANGEKDKQISAERDAKPLAAAFGDQATLYVSPNTSHNFKAVDKPTDLGMSGPVVPGFIEELKKWLRKQNA